MEHCDTIQSSKPCLPTPIAVGGTQFSSENTALIKLPIVIKIFVLSIIEWPFYTGFTVHASSQGSGKSAHSQRLA